MVTSAASRVAQALRQTVGSETVSDRELLARFANDGDERAFATLFQRHSAMVLGVCRRMLLTLQDAEDACQATFLVLSRKAKTERWQVSIANWLYATARRIAWNAQTAARRRNRHESQATPAAPADPADLMTARELLAVLDHELGNLAPLYREPLILCYLEGLSRESVARRLGLPSGTVKIRLERGRKHLGAALIRRGCGFSVGLLALDNTSRAGASPSRLLQRVLAAVAGKPSPAAAQLARGIAMQGIMSTGRAVILAIAGALSLAFGSAVVPGTEAPKEMATTDGKGGDKSQLAGRPFAAKATRIVTGKVVTVDGKPIRADLYYSGQKRTESLGSTNADGTFRVTLPVQEPAPMLMAAAPGQGIDFVLPAQDKAVTLTLPPDVPIRGTLLDPQGLPVIGAAVEVQWLQAAIDNSLHAYLDQWKQRTHFRQSVELPRHAWFEGAKPFGIARTDANGHFEILGVGAERLVGLHVSGAGRAVTDIRVITRNGFDPKPYNANTLSLRPTTGEKLSWSWNPLFTPPEFTLPIEPEKLIRGRLTDARTNGPRANVEVVLHQDDGNSNQELRATTDADGRYTIRGAKKLPTYSIRTAADTEKGYLLAFAEAQDSAGYEPILANLACPKGVIVTGQVRDGATGKAIAARVDVNVLLDNKFLPKFSAVKPGEKRFAKQSFDDGHYRVVTIPGHVLLEAAPADYEARKSYKPPQADVKYPQFFHNKFEALGYYGPQGMMGIVDASWCKVLDLKETDEVVTQDISFEPALRMTMRVVGPDGKPVKNVHATGTTHIGWGAPEPVGDTDRITVYNLESGQKRLVAAIERKRKLVGAARIEGGKNDAVIKLDSGGSIHGRVVDDSGKPLGGITVKLNFERREVAEIYGGFADPPHQQTDADGKFSFTGLIPGFEFVLQCNKGKKVLGPEYRKLPKHKLDKDGEVKSVGDIKVDPLQIEPGN